MTFTVAMSEAVTVNTTSGTPTLTLNDGGTATYTAAPAPMHSPSATPSVLGRTRPT